MSTITIVPKSNSLIFSPARIQKFQKKVFSFYKKNKRDLPWRKTTDPYKILLSELMLQQTQVNRVLMYYEKWITRWPTIDALASSSLAEVLHAWIGLGYNTRAVNLHKAARKIVAEFDGVKTNIISLSHLKANKKASGRHQDIADLVRLP